MKMKLKDAVIRLIIPFNHVCEVILSTYTVDVGDGYV
jgi:hypothetical protein